MERPGWVGGSQTDAVVIVSLDADSPLGGWIDNISLTPVKVMMITPLGSKSDGLAFDHVENNGWLELADGAKVHFVDPKLAISTETKDGRSFHRLMAGNVMLVPPSLVWDELETVIIKVQGNKMRVAGEYMSPEEKKEALGIE